MDIDAPTTRPAGIHVAARALAVAAAVAVAVLVAGPDPASAAGRRPGSVPVATVSAVVLEASSSSTSGFRAP